MLHVFLLRLSQVQSQVFYRVLLRKVYVFSAAHGAGFFAEGDAYTGTLVRRQVSTKTVVVFSIGKKEKTADWL